MKTKIIFLTLALVCSFSINAQQKSHKPNSIYTLTTNLTKSGFSSLNQKLQLSDFNFVYVDLLDLDLNQFSVDFNNIGKHPSTLIYDDYNAYRDENLLKGFRLKYDPTRWNLQCPSPLSVQPTE
jgi:hypothetical protein